MEESGKWVPESELSDWEFYKKEVRRKTESTYKKCKEDINPNNHKRVLCGKEGYQLDHIVSVLNGFRENIPVEEISSTDNLQMLPWKENRNKGF